MDTSKVFDLLDKLKGVAPTKQSFDDDVKYPEHVCAVVTSHGKNGEEIAKRVIEAGTKSRKAN